MTREIKNSREQENTKCNICQVSFVTIKSLTIYSHVWTAEMRMLTRANSWRVAGNTNCSFLQSRSFAKKITIAYLPSTKVHIWVTGLFIGWKLVNIHIFLYKVFNDMHSKSSIFLNFEEPCTIIWTFSYCNSVSFIWSCTRPKSGHMWELRTGQHVQGEEVAPRPPVIINVFLSVFSKGFLAFIPFQLPKDSQVSSYWYR